MLVVATAFTLSRKNGGGGCIRSGREGCARSRLVGGVLQLRVSFTMLTEP